MDNKQRTPLRSAPTPAPLDKFDFDKDLDSTPITPGPLLHQQVAGKHTSKGKTVGMILLTVLLLAAVGAAGYMYWQNMQLQDQVNQKQSQVSTLTTENAKLNDDITQVKEADEEAVKVSDEDQAKLVASAAVQAATENKDLLASITKVKGDFAFAEVKHKDPAVDEGFSMILKKSNETWVEIWRGQDRTLSDKQNLNKTYGVPEDF